MRSASGVSPRIDPSGHRIGAGAARTITDTDAAIKNREPEGVSSPNARFRFFIACSGKKNDAPGYIGAMIARDRK
jgi:hypothetical protein